MAREIDRRDRRTSRRAAGPELGVALLGAAGADGGYIERALAFLQATGSADRATAGLLGATGAAEPLDFVADPQVQMTSASQAVVHAQQYHRGIPVFKATETVRFSADGQIVERVGSSIELSGQQPIAIRISAEMAALTAVHYAARADADDEDIYGTGASPAGFDPAGFVPRVRARASDQPAQTTTFEPGPTGDSVTASLVWFPIDGGIQLGWEVVISLPAQLDQYRLVISASTGEIWYCRSTLPCLAAIGNVYRLRADQLRELTPFPVDLASYRVGGHAPLPASFPTPWVNGQLLDGDYACITADGAPMSVRGVARDGRLLFDPPSWAGIEQLALNAFYFICHMHDYFYLLGFREGEGCFQRGGPQTDRIEARILREQIPQVATMWLAEGGPAAVMTLGSYSATGHHTALDASVVFHEYTHGVTRRLIGGRGNRSVLEDPQGRAMGEGWSDFFACAVTGGETIGAWLIGCAGGLRSHPYSPAYPITAADLGQGRYRFIHAAGEIWCATLLAMSRQIGLELSVQLVVDSLKLLSPEPTFLEARDALLVALDAKRDAGQISSADHGPMRAGIWRAFAQHGMGRQAVARDTSLDGLAADFTPDVEPQPQSGVSLSDTPDMVIPDNRPAGITRVLTVALPGRVSDIQVGLDIGHTYISDLQVGLRNPAGRLAVLHNRAGGAEQNLARQYSPRDTPSLSAFLGGPAQGNWVLEVADLVELDQGTLRSWSLSLAVTA